MARTASAEQKIVSADRKGEDLSNRVLLASIREGHGSFVLLICDSGETVVHSKTCGSQGGNILAKIPVSPQWVELAFDHDQRWGRYDGYCGNCVAWDPRPRSER